MVFGSKVVLPADITFWAPRVENYNVENSNQARLIEVDSLEEVRLVTCVQTAKYLDDLRRYYNRNVNDWFFVVEDLVLHRKQKTDGMHKLSSPWEGHFIVKAVTRPGSYRLCDMDGRDVPNSWHIDMLRRFYPWSIPFIFEYSIKFFTLMFLHIVFSMLFR